MQHDAKLGAIAAIEAALEGSRQGARARARRDVSDALRSSALHLFLERGFDAVTVSEIAQQAGVTPRTFFRYFQTKETVIVDIMDETNSRLIELIRGFSANDTVVNGLRETFRAWFSEVEGLMAVLADFAQSSPSLNAALLHRQSEWERRLSATIQQSYAAMSERTARMWGVLAFALMRLIYEDVNAGGMTYAEAIDAVFDDFSHETATV